MVEKGINLGRFFQLAAGKKIYIYGKKLHETKKPINFDYPVEFEIMESMLIGEIEQETINRLEKINDFETYANAIDVAHDSEDVILTRWLHK